MWRALVIVGVALLRGAKGKLQHTEGILFKSYNWRSSKLPGSHFQDMFKVVKIEVQMDLFA